MKDKMKMDHDKMDHSMNNMNHSQMDHSMHNMDHGNMDHSMHGGMQMNGMSHMGNLKLKMIVALILGLPVLFLSPMMGIKFPFQFSFPGSDWVVLIFSTIVFLYGGYPFIMGAGEEIKAKKPEMMTLIMRAAGPAISAGSRRTAWLLRPWIPDRPWRRIGAAG